MTQEGVINQNSAERRAENERKSANTIDKQKRFTESRRAAHVLCASSA